MIVCHGILSGGNKDDERIGSVFDKRLLEMVPSAKKYIFANVAFQWIALAANVALMVAIGLFLQDMLYGAATQNDLARLLTLAAFAIVVRMACQTAAQRMGFAAASLAKRVIRQEVYDKLVRLGPAYTERIATNEAVQICTEGVEQLEVYFGSYIPQLFYAVLAPITLFGFLAPLSPTVAIILFVCVPLIPLSIVLIQRIAKRVVRDYWNSYTDLGGTFLENVQGLTTLKIYQADAMRHEVMNAQAESFRRATMRLLRMQLNSITVMDLLAYGGAALGIVVALFQFADGSIAFAGAFTIVFLSAEFFIPMRALGSLFHTAMNGMAAADKMFDLLAAPDPDTGIADAPANACRVECRGLTYSYDGERRALENVDLDAAECCMTAIVGESGSGKSTLAGVLSGRNAAYEGEVRIGGVNVRDIRRASLMDSVTTVTFSSHLFRGTIRDNLLMGDPNANDSDMWSALSRCRLADFVREAGGLDAPVSEAGANLSGGQRQRLAIARALLHDSPVYIFDEATSNIDAASEHAIMEVIHELAREKTVIVISHRLSAVTNAARIYVMKDGRAVEHGTHAELLAANGAYADLWNRQQELEAYATDTHEDAGIARSESVEADATVIACDALVNANKTTIAGTNANEAAAGDSAATSATNPVISTPKSAEAGKKTAEMTGNVEDGRTNPPHRSGIAVMARLITLVKPLLSFMALAVILGVVGFAAAIFLTVYGASGLLAASGIPTITGFGAAVALIAICGVTRGFFHYGEQICNHYIAFKLLALIRDRVFTALRRLAPAKLESRDKGNLLSMATSDIELLEVFYAHTISPVLIAALVSLGMTAFIATQAWQLAIVAACAYLVIGVGVPLISSRGAGAAGLEFRNQLGDANSYVLESLRGLYEVLQYGRATERSRELVARTVALSDAESKIKNRTGLFTAVTGGLVLAFDATAITCAYLLFSQGALTFSEAVISVMAIMSSFGPVLAVAALGTTLQQTIASGARVLDVLDETPQCADIVNGRNAEFNGAATQNVTFAYGDEVILDNVTIEFPKGRVVNIVGKSGSGKSTLLKLLMRFWDPTQGSVRMSDVDLREVNTASLRQAQSYMTQDTHLFDGTIADNILIAKQGATREELESACRKASLDGLIERLPKGLDTPVGELGGALSGGERQRIGLARVFLHDAPFVLLDEPTSNPDSLTEASVLKSLAEFREDKTIVLVSHRASTCAFADMSYSVERGRMS